MLSLLLLLLTAHHLCQPLGPDLVGRLLLLLLGIIRGAAKGVALLLLLVVAVSSSAGASAEGPGGQIGKERHTCIGLELCS